MKLVFGRVVIPGIVVVFIGCGKDEPGTLNTTPPATYPVVVTPVDNTTPIKNYSYLALGNSYTIGQSVSPDQRFPAQTVELLLKNNVKVNAPFYIATTGWTTINLMSAITTSTITPPYDVLSLLIGVNDQYQFRDTTGYRERFTALLEKSIQLSGNKPSRVFVLSIPDYSATPFVPPAQKLQVSKEVDWFNAINKDVAEQRKISYTDITRSTRDASSNSALVATDGLHPSGLEYAKWAMMLAPKIKAAL
ncbi:MAG: GDSL-type esterase/lipase family protein [Chitinophagaceae bacterium]|nr:GDSL-type esterase/lipase family protein [Chitinophagaceae bacterium]